MPQLSAKARRILKMLKGGNHAVMLTQLRNDLANWPLDEIDDAIDELQAQRLAYLHPGNGEPTLYYGTEEEDIPHIDGEETEG